MSTASPPTCGEVSGVATQREASAREPYSRTASSSSRCWWALERQPLLTCNATPSSAASAKSRYKVGIGDQSVNVFSDPLFQQLKLKRIRYIGNEGPEKWAGAVADHEEMIAALEARDADRLSRILTAHMEKTWERVRHAI